MKKLFTLLFEFGLPGLFLSAHRPAEFCHPRTGLHHTIAIGRDKSAFVGLLSLLLWDSLRWPAGITAETRSTHPLFCSAAGTGGFRFKCGRVFGPIRYDIPVCAASTQTVQWTIEGMEQASSVHLFGSFNAWNREALQLERSAAGWQVELELKAGQYEYKLMVDGKEKTDPSNADSVSNGMGGFNSVLRVEESGEPVQVRALTHGKNFISLNAIPDDQELLVLWENHLLNTRKSLRTGGCTTFRSRNRLFARGAATFVFFVRGMNRREMTC